MHRRIAEIVIVLMPPVLPNVSAIAARNITGPWKEPNVDKMIAAHARLPLVAIPGLDKSPARFRPRPRRVVMPLLFRLAHETDRRQPVSPAGIYSKRSMLMPAAASATPLETGRPFSAVLGLG